MAAASETQTPGVPTRNYAVLPRDTDPGISAALGAHQVFVGNCPTARGQLLVWLPGTGGLASPTGPLLQLAARNCMHAVGLNYPNETSAVGDCVRERPEPDCYAAWRLEKVDGMDRSPKINVAPADSVDNLLLKLLRYLAMQHPDEGWEQYLDGAAVRWDKVIVGGISQGGGQAAMLAKVHSVARVVMLAAVTDSVGSLRGPAPAWESHPGATPPERYFGFANQRDAFWTGERNGWLALGLGEYGPIVNVDSTSPPYGGTHRLTTDVACPQARVENCAHGTVAMPSLAPQLTAAWEYLLGLR